MIGTPIIIHVGKCGGSSVKSVLPDTYKTLHATRPALGQNGKYVVVIRNPIDRFVSAFYHMYSAYSVCDTVNQEALNHIEKNTQRFNLYKTANGLAEAIYDEEGKLNIDAHHLITRDDLPSVGIYIKADSGTTKTLIKTHTIMDLVNDEGIETNQHMDNHLGMNIAWYIEDLIKNQPESIVGVIRCEHIHGDVLSVLGFECKERRNSHTLHDNWGKPYDDTLSDKAVNNLKRYLKKDYECLLTLKDLGLIDEEYYNFCLTG